MKFSKLVIDQQNQIAEIHQKAFSGFFLTNLGFRFLSTFYKSIIKSNDSICIGIFDENKLIGFAIGAKKRSGFYNKLLINNFFQLSFSALIPIIKQPSLLFRLFSSFKSSSPSFDNLNDSAILLSICIDPAFGSKKFGKSLLIEFEKYAAEYADSILLTTDYLNNEYVNSFYVRNGYIKLTTFHQGKRLMNCYIKHLNK